MPKLYDNLASAAIQALKTILQERKRTSHVLQKITAKHPKWGARDRRTVYTIVYDCIRWRRLFANMIQANFEEISEDQLLSVWCHRNEFIWNNNIETLRQNELKNMPPEVLASYPDWLFALGSKELPSLWDQEYAALNKQAAVSIRVNRLRSHPEKLQMELQQRYAIKSRLMKGFPDALQLEQGRKLNKNSLFLKGYFEIQDAHSQKIAPFTKVAPGMNVIDMCAGAGGKSLHLAALMRNKGQLLAYDLEETKLKSLHQRSERAGVKIIQSNLLKKDTELPENKKWADVVLIDAPCSGLGTLKRNPELKWRLSLEQIETLQDTQFKLLESAAEWVKPKGVLVYATCSILPSENERQIEQFLNKNQGFELEEKQQLYAHQSEFDGFFMARLKRTI